MRRFLSIIAAAFIFLPPVSARAAEDFPGCLQRLQQRAENAGVAPNVIARVMPGLKQQERVLELDRQQPEFVQTFGEYLKTRVSEDRIQRGRALYSRYRPFLDRLSAEFGVPGQYLVAFWGLETNFGGYLGNMPTLDSLATLACDRRRSDFFSNEFITALRVMQREGLEPGDLRGSWAGAIGHTQFMPSNYYLYAIDGDGDGKKNLLGSELDALASGANFLNHLGWEPGLRWGREVRLPSDFNYHLAGGDARVLEEWAALGVIPSRGGVLPAAPIEARLIVPAGHQGPAFLVYDNFSVIMKWNRSEFYALSVGLLADRIAGGGGLFQPPPQQRSLAIADVKSLQTALNSLGYDAGETDGVLGPSTRRAISDYEKDKGMVSDGFPDAKVLEALLEAAGTN